MLNKSLKAKKNPVHPELKFRASVSAPSDRYLFGTPSGPDVDPYSLLPHTAPRWMHDVAYGQYNALACFDAKNRLTLPRMPQ